VNEIYEKGLGLKIMSLDFNTTESVTKNQRRIWNDYPHIGLINFHHKHIKTVTSIW